MPDLTPDDAWRILHDAAHGRTTIDARMATDLREMLGPLKTELKRAHLRLDALDIAMGRKQPRPILNRAGGVEAIAAERQRQIDIEGFTPDHDDKYREGEMALAAACLAEFRAGAVHRPAHIPPFHWPWKRYWWKPRDHRANLVRAGALIAAEIDRLDRAAGKVAP